MYYHTWAMDLHVINPSSVLVGVALPPTKAEKNVLTQIHSTIVGRFESYDNYAFLPPAGAKIFQEGVGEILILPDKVQFFEEIRSISFQVVKEKAVEIFNLIFAKIKPSVFLAMGIKLVALIEMGSENGAVEFIHSRIAPSLKKDQLDVLGPTLMGTGLRFNMIKDRPAQSHYDLRVEPFFRDRSKLYVELDVQFPQAMPNLSELEGRIQHVSNYLKQEVKEFLEQF